MEQIILDPGHGMWPPIEDMKSIVAHYSLGNDRDVKTLGAEEGWSFGRPLMSFMEGGVTQFYREDSFTPMAAQWLRSQLRDGHQVGRQILQTRHNHYGPWYQALVRNQKRLINHGKSRDLVTRVNLANHWYSLRDRSIFVSIHTNAGPSSARGFEVIHSRSSSSRRLSKCIHDSVDRFGIKVREQKQGDFYVLRKTRMPAVIIECGFHTNAVDICNLVIDRENLFNAIATGINIYYAEWPK